MRQLGTRDRSETGVGSWVKRQVQGTQSPNLSANQAKGGSFQDRPVRALRHLSAVRAGISLPVVAVTWNCAVVLGSVYERLALAEMGIARSAFFRRSA